MKGLDYNTNKFFLVYFALLGLVLFLYMLSRNDNKFTCDDWANDFRDGFYCRLILTDTSGFPVRGALIGRDLETNVQVTVEDGSKWIAHNLFLFKFGDTIIKERGKCSILIKRKGIQKTILFECDGKSYADK